REPITLPTTLARSGPAARNHAAFGLQSSLLPISRRSVGWSMVSHSPAWTNSSTKRRRRKASVSMRFKSVLLRPPERLEHFDLAAIHDDGGAVQPAAARGKDERGHGRDVAGHADARHI